MRLAAPATVHAFRYDKASGLVVPTRLSARRTAGRGGRGRYRVALPSSTSGGGGGGAGGGSGAPASGKPVFDASNINHKRHFYDAPGVRLAAGGGVASLYSSTRTDGGGTWTRQAGAVLDPETYISIEDDALDFNYTDDPPIEDHDLTSPYTAAHSGPHWHVGGNDVSIFRRTASNNITSRTSTTVTDSSKNYTVNGLVGWGTIDFYTGPFVGSTYGGGTYIGSRAIVSNTATEITFSPSLDISSAASFGVGAQGDLHSCLRGINGGAWLNKPGHRVLVIKFIISENGTAFFEGKGFDFGAGSSSGLQRWLIWDHDAEAFGDGGMLNVTTNELAAAYYNSAATTGDNAKFAGMPPTMTTRGFSIWAGNSALAPVHSGKVHRMIKQNMNYGSAEGEWSYTNADGLGLGTTRMNAGKIEVTVQITLENPSSYVMGTGRVDAWVNPLDGLGEDIKVAEYWGDRDSGTAFETAAFGRVGVDPTGSNTVPGSWETMPMFRPPYQAFAGGARRRLYEIDVWSKPYS